MIEAKKHLFPLKEIEEVEKFLATSDIFRSPIIPLDPIERGTLIRLQSLKPPPEDSEEFWAKIAQLQKVVQDTLNLFLNFGQQPKLLAKYGMKWKGEILFDLTIEGQGKYRLSHVSLVGAHEKYLYSKIFDLFNGLPAATLKRCSDGKCGKLFLNLTLRNKKFCSPKCGWRFNAESRRKGEGREKYKEYQKEVMKDRYRVKIGLKPRKFYRKSRNKKTHQAE